MKYVYIDESGETGSSSKYIVFASIETKKHRTVEKAIKKIWRAKPHLHSQGELHAHAVDDATRKRVLLTLNDLEISVRHHVFDKKKAKAKLDTEYYRILASFVNAHKRAHIIIVDKKDTNKKRVRAIKQLKLDAVFKDVQFEESYRVKQLQAVDFIAWALGRFYELEDDTYTELIKDITK